MSDTPKTDVLREVIFGQYKEDELTGNGMGNILIALRDIEALERKRECECKCDVDWPEEYYELRQRLERERDAERALADRLAEGLRKMAYYSEALILRIQDRSDINFKTLNECIDLFNEWKEARND